MCTRNQTDKSYHLLVILACFKLICPFLPSALSKSAVESIPSEILRACQILIKFHDLFNASVDNERPSLLNMVRLVSAVRNSDPISAQKHACALLLPSNAGSLVDPFCCYHYVRNIFLSAKMHSELCDLLSLLHETCISSGQNGPEGLFQHTISACVDCGRFLGVGGAVQLLNSNDFPTDPNVIQNIIERAVHLRRLDVLRPNEALGNDTVAQVFSPL